MKKYNIWYKRIETEEELEEGISHERQLYFPEPISDISQLAAAIQFLKVGDHQTPGGLFRFSVFAVFEKGDYILNLQTLEVRLYKETNNGILVVYDTDDKDDMNRMCNGYTRTKVLDWWIPSDCIAFSELDNEYIVGKKGFGTTAETQDMIFNDMTNIV